MISLTATPEKSVRITKKSGEVVDVTCGSVDIVCGIGYFILSPEHKTIGFIPYEDMAEVAMVETIKFLTDDEIKDLLTLAEENYSGG